MTLNGVTYCNICGLEILAGEETREFTMPGVLREPGHSHGGACLNVRNAAIRDYEQLFWVLIVQLDPEIRTLARTTLAIKRMLVSPETRRVPPREKGSGIPGLRYDSAPPEEALN